MKKPIRSIAVLWLTCTLLSPLTFSSATFAQDRQRQPPVETGTQKSWPVDQDSIVKKSAKAKDQVTLSNEPVMRIALSTGTRTASISTTARLLNAYNGVRLSPVRGAEIPQQTVEIVPLHARNRDELRKVPRTALKINASSAQVPS